MTSQKPDWKTIDWAPINCAQDQIVAALRSLEGIYFKEVASELHAPRLEMPIWVLLYDPGEIVGSHHAIKTVLAPHFQTLGPVTCTIVYLFLSETYEIQVDFLEGHAEIEAAPDARPLAARPMTGPRPESPIFASKTSCR